MPLCQRGKQRLNRDLIDRLIIFLEWLITLPPEIQDYYTEQVGEFEEKTTAPYVTIPERKVIERGRQEGREEGQA